MKKLEAKKTIIDYLKYNGIQYTFLNEEHKVREINFVDTIYLCVEIPEVIGKHIETCLRFKDEHLYCQSYYCQPIAKNEEEAFRAARIVNFLNMHLDYDCNSLYEHTFVFDEDHGDIFNGCLIRYELLEKFFDETMNHILNYSVQQLVDVCVPVVMCIANKISYLEATKVAIEHNLMGKPISCPEE